MCYCGCGRMRIVMSKTQKNNHWSLVYHCPLYYVSLTITWKYINISEIYITYFIIFNNLCIVGTFSLFYMSWQVWSTITSTTSCQVTRLNAYNKSSKFSSTYWLLLVEHRRVLLIIYHLSSSYFNYCWVNIYIYIYYLKNYHL